MFFSWFFIFHFVVDCMVFLCFCFWIILYNYTIVLIFNHNIQYIIQQDHLLSMNNRNQ